MIDWGDESAAAYTSWADNHPERPVLGALMRFDAGLIGLLTPRSPEPKPDYRLITELVHRFGIAGAGVVP